MSFFNTKEIFVIMEELSLVIQIVNVFKLLIIRSCGWRQSLIYITLSNGYVILHIRHIILVDEIIALVIHTFYNVISNIIIKIRSNLEHCFFTIMIEVPSYNSDKFFFVVFSKDLNYIMFTSFNQFQNLSIICKFKVNRLKVFAIYFINGKIKHRVVLYLQRIFVLTNLSEL